MIGGGDYLKIFIVITADRLYNKPAYAALFVYKVMTAHILTARLEYIIMLILLNIDIIS